MDYLICAMTILINSSGIDWNEFDGRMKQRASYVCANDPYYSEDTPRLKSFEKTEVRSYRAICGPEESDE